MLSVSRWLVGSSIRSMSWFESMSEASAILIFHPPENSVVSLVASFSGLNPRPFRVLFASDSKEKPPFASNSLWSLSCRASVFLSSSEFSSSDESFSSV